MSGHEARAVVAVLADGERVDLGVPDSEDTIEMSAMDVRTLMMDDWEWMHSFLFSNVRYSNSAAEYAKTKGVVL